MALRLFVYLVNGVILLSLLALLVYSLLLGFGMRHTSPKTFGSVIEAEVKGCIDFDTGKTFDEMPESVSSSSIALSVLNALEWAERNGVDAFVDNSILLGLNLKVGSLEDATWTTVTPEQAKQALNKAAAQKSQPFQPGTSVFETREGGLGVVQILGPGKDGGLRLQYKLTKGRLGGK